MKGISPVLPCKHNPLGTPLLFIYNRSTLFVINSANCVVDPTR